ncbi:uncharacterized protein LOC108047308 isoform X2 [Drosophila rhopaloa]|uniref:Ig-like domain-containing protein n=1 Tax=Drosophila rhopaloa TaxID=1041015 RepID=A0ABM5JAF2_DRORH|nr:uncharacterized protein LOC108047308 isoform X2 [Drosophila rhopaloa]
MFGPLNLLAALFFIGTLKDFSVAGLKLTEVRIPKYVVKDSPAQLECLYDLDGEALYSVKWYKDGNEFYRYVPRDMPPAQTFLLPGVIVDLHNSSDATVTLRNVNLQSTGRFRCEVSGEAPSFQTVTEHGDMIVVFLPDQGSPKISGGRPRYQVGDYVKVNCTSGRSKPAVELSWQVNGEPADKQKLRKYNTIVEGRDGLETSVLGLQFRVEQRHFRNGDMKLKCIAELSSLYWRSNEESVEGDRPQKAPALESRETAYASNSRADPVQAGSTAPPSSTPPAPLLLLVVSLAVVGAVATLAQGIAQDIDVFKIPMDRTATGGMAKGDPEARELLAGREEEKRSARPGKSEAQLGKISLSAR